VPTGWDEAGEARLAALPERRRALYVSLLQERARIRIPGVVERLRPGLGESVVLVHSVGGEVFCYAGLVEHLLTRRPVSAIAADAALADPEGVGLSELAAHYLRRVEREGLWPAVFAGWSFGGVLAYEMGRQFADRVEARPVVLLDSAYTPARYWGMARSSADLAQSFVSDLLLSGGHRPEAGRMPDAVWERPDSEALGLVLDQLAAHGIRLGLTVPDLVIRYQIYANSLRALDDYSPPPSCLSVGYVRADQWHEDLSEPWRPLVGDMRVLSVSADHYGLMRPPAVAEVARFLDEECGLV